MRKNILDRASHYIARIPNKSNKSLPNLTLFLQLISDMEINKHIRMTFKNIIYNAILSLSVTMVYVDKTRKDLRTENIERIIKYQENRHEEIKRLLPLLIKLGFQPHDFPPRVQTVLGIETPKMWIVQHLPPVPEGKNKVSAYLKRPPPTVLRGVPLDSIIESDKGIRYEIDKISGERKPLPEAAKPYRFGNKK